MTRNEILESYTVNSQGVITSPGKFESEMLYVPYFWEISADGTAEILDWSDGDSSYLIDIDSADLAEWPELPRDTVALHLQESDVGFVSCETLTLSELEKLRAWYDRDYKNNDDSED